jgi:hypothetical protein
MGSAHCQDGKAECLRCVFRISCRPSNGGRSRRRSRGYRPVLEKTSQSTKREGLKRFSICELCPSAICCRLILSGQFSLGSYSRTKIHYGTPHSRPFCSLIVHLGMVSRFLLEPTPLSHAIDHSWIDLFIEPCFVSRSSIPIVK